VRLFAALGDKLQKIAGPKGAYAAGQWYRDRGDFRTAIGAFRNAEKQWRSTDPGGSTGSLLQVAYCRRRLGDVSGARLDYEEALRRVRANPTARDMPKENEVVTLLEDIKYRGTEI
jgi:hypothetical protein